MRLLPVLIAVSAAALVVKAGGVWEGVVQARDAVAAEQVAAADPMVKSAQAQTGEEESEAAAVSAEEEPSDLPKVQGLEADPFSMTDEEVEILQSLAARREELEARERQLDQREVLLQAAERRIDEKIAELEKLQGSIEGLIVKHDDQTEEQISSLVKIYESMKPKDAARIFEELDMAVLLDVIERMKERKTAPILAEMDPKKAKAVTLELAQRRSLPLAKE